MKKIKRFLLKISPVLVFVCIFLVLELAVKIFDIQNYVLPSPIASFEKLFSDFGTIWPHLKRTFIEIICGYSLGSCVGISLALLFTSSKLMSKAISPYVTLIICTPQIIMVPLLMMWMGFGIQVIIVASALSCFAINMMNTMSGVENVSKARCELMKSLKASKLQTFFRVLIPSALPSVFTGLKIGCIFAVSGAIGAEMIGGTVGLGSRVLFHSDNFQMDIMFAYVYVVILLGVLLYTTVNFIEKKVVKEC